MTSEEIYTCLSGLPCSDMWLAMFV